jgi:acetolactate synthase I/II/III large subunit
MPKAVDVIVEVLKREGIDRIFGIPGGGSTTDLVHAASRVGIEPVLSGHEGSSAIIASVYGEIKDKPGVCFSITGPGATNMASGVAYAFLERVPLLAFTECHPSKNYEFITTQKIDQKAFFTPITKNRYTLTAGKAQEIVEKALICAKEERPGPVHLDFPNDEASGESAYKAHEKTEMVRLSQFVPEDSKPIRKMIDRIGQARAPVIIAGIEAKRGNAREVLTALAEKWNVPVMVSLKGRGVFDEDHPLYGGVFLGSFSKGTFEDAIIGRSDLLLLVGVDGIEFLPKPWALNQPVIHIACQANIDAIYPSELQAVGDIKTILGILACHAPGPNQWERGYLETTRREMKEKLSYSREDLPLHRIIQMTRDKLPSDGILTTDVGAFNSLVHYLWQVRQPKTYFTSKGLSTMGIALPAAIAAQIALPDRKVVCFTGDGGFLMRLQELEMCSRLHLPIVIVVFSDSGLGLIRVKQKDKGYEAAAVRLKNPDFSALVQAFGGIGYRVQTEKEFDRALESAINESKLCLIEAVLDPDTYGDHMKLIRG